MLMMNNMLVWGMTGCCTDVSQCSEWIETPYSPGKIVMQSWRACLACGRTMAADTLGIEENTRRALSLLCSS